MNVAKNSVSGVSRATLDIWRQYEKLLKEAVYKDHYFGLLKLLENEHLVPSINEFKKRSSKPLIAAIAGKDVCMIDLMCKYGYKLPQPHPRQCSCENCNGNRFGQIKGQMAALKALCNPVWISVSAEDPIETVLKLQSMEEEFERVSGSFAMEFEELSNKNEEFLVSLIDQIKSEEELTALMRHKTIPQNSDCHGMEFVNLVIDNVQKKVVAESEVQYFVESKVFSTIPKWDQWGIWWKIVVTILIAVFSPVTCLLNILMPSSCCPSVSEFALRPYVKFVNGAVSYITFLALLIVMGAAERNGIRNSDTPTGIEIAVFVWLVGFCFQEMRDLYKSGVKGYFSNGWNYIDIAMDFFMLVTYIFWFVLYGLVNNDHITKEKYIETMFIADGTFCVAIIFSFFRLLYLCQASSYLGLIQICLGEMIMVIWQFGFVAIVNLLGFTVAMVYLFHSSTQGRKNISALETKYKDESGIYACFEENFYGFFSTLFTLVFLSLGVADTGTLTNFEDGTLVHLWANIFFIAYIGISMIVLLNMLIAMMSTSYQVIADNNHTEHLFYQTKLWMEYIGTEKERPVPLNLIPRVQTIIDLFCYAFCCSDKRNAPTDSLEIEEKRKYKKLTDALVKRYLRSEFGCPDFAEPPEAGSDIDEDPFIKKIDAICEDFKSGVGSVGMAGEEELNNFGYDDEKKPSLTKQISIKIATASV